MDICQTCKYLSKHYCKYFKTKNIDMLPNTHCVTYKKKIEKPVRNQIKKNSIKQEKRLSKDLGAKRTPMSGAKDTSPTDMVRGNYVIESKATNKDSMVLHKEWLDQLKQSPMNYGKIATLVLDFTNTGDRYVMLDIVDFQKIIKGE